MVTLEPVDKMSGAARGVFADGQRVGWYCDFDGFRRFFPFLGVSDAQAQVVKDELERIIGSSITLSSSS